jgi:hypothetical protein
MPEYNSFAFFVLHLYTRLRGRKDTGMSRVGHPVLALSCARGITAALVSSN